MSWPENIGSSQFLKNLYEGYPSLDRVEIVSIQFRRDGPSCSISFITTEIPINIPKKNWDDFNAVGIEIELFPIRNIIMGNFGRDGYSSIIMKDKSNEEILVDSRGSVVFSAKAKHLLIKKIMPMLREI